MPKLLLPLAQRLQRGAATSSELVVPLLTLQSSVLFRLRRYEQKACQPGGEPLHSKTFGSMCQQGAPAASAEVKVAEMPVRDIVRE